MFRWLQPSRQPQRRAGLADFLRSRDRSTFVVCEHPKFIYFKTARAAGTSILRRHLQPLLPDLLLKRNDPDRYFRWLDEITDEKLEDYFIFTVVRNPWDRLVSIASFFGFHFPHFVRHLEEYWEDLKVRAHSLPCHASTHCNGLCFADQICRFECLQPDYNLVCDQIGLKRTFLEMANPSRHEHYSHYYNDEERLIVERVYAEDIRLFGYVFERRHAARTAETASNTDAA